MDSSMDSIILVRPLPLMSKGESDLVWWLPSSPKGEIVGIMAKVLSLMATYSGDGSLYNRTVAELVYNRTVAEIGDQLSNIEENNRYAAPQKAQLRRCAAPQKVKCVATQASKRKAAYLI